MSLEKFLFPAPNPPHYTLTSHGKHLFWLPRIYDSNQTQAIPCMIYSPMGSAHFFIIWCHCNGCDIGSMHTTLIEFSRLLNVHVLIFEYPSYGLCQETITASKETINNHAERAYSFVHDILQWPADRIIMYGHSIGSGPACHIASVRQIGGLILQSPYTSIKNWMQEKIGMHPWIADISYWDNIAAIENITIPVLFIHGQMDGLIPPQHSQILYNTLTSNNQKQFVLLPNDDHNSININVVISIVESFLNLYFPFKFQPMPHIEIDPTLFQSPTTIQPQSTNFPTFAFTISGVPVNATQFIMPLISSTASSENNEQQYYQFWWNFSSH